MIIGISGEARHGKGTVAQAMQTAFATRGVRVQIISYADPLKDFLTLVIGRSEPFRGSDAERNAPVPEIRWRDLSDSIKHEAIGLGWLTAETLDAHPSGRQLMQLFGTTTIRDHFLHDAWIRIAKTRARRHAGITLIDDTRFNNEAVKHPSGHNDLLVKVFRPGQDNGAASKHSSETGPRAIPDEWLDGTLLNDDSVAVLAKKARDLLRQWWSAGKLGQYLDPAGLQTPLPG